MKHLYFIRHAESEANEKRILASRLPFPLTDAGIEDARRIAQEFKTMVSLDRIVTSPLLRARQTADAFRDAFGLEPEEDGRLAEQHLGKFSGLSYDEVKALPDYESDVMARWDWVPDGGGESYAMIADRVIDFLSSAEEWPKGSRTLVVTHAVVFRLLRSVLENTLPAYPKGFPNNGEIWEVAFGGVGRRHEIRSLFLGESRRFVHNP